MAQSFPITSRLYFDSVGALTILLAACPMARFMDRRPFATPGFVPARFLRDSLLGVIIGFIWLASSLLLMRFFGAVTGIAMILNTVNQEILARGYILQTIRSNHIPGKQPHGPYRLDELPPALALYFIVKQVTKSQESSLRRTVLTFTEYSSCRKWTVRLMKQVLPMNWSSERELPVHYILDQVRT